MSQQENSTFNRHFTIEPRVDRIFEDERRLRLPAPVSAFLSVSLLLYLATMGLGWWLGFDAAAAQARIALLGAGLLLMVVVAYGVAWRSDVGLGILALAAAGAAAAVALIFILVHPWQEAARGDFNPLQPYGSLAQSTLAGYVTLPAIPATLVQSNAVAGALVILAPLGMAGTFWLARRWHWAPALLVALLTLMGMAGIALTGSRGAWIGFGVGMPAAGYISLRVRSGSRGAFVTALDGLLILGLLAAVVAYWLIVISPGISQWLGIQALLNDSWQSRLVLWRHSLMLAEDLRFTGAGMAGLAMVFSSYAYLFHVPLFYHAHNLYLQIALEQGLPGLVAFLCLAGGSIWALAIAWRTTHGGGRALAAGVTAALIGMLVHGLFDAELYAGPLAPLIFLPMGMAWGLARVELRREVGLWEHDAPNLVHTMSAWLAPLALVLLLFAWPGSQAAIYANLGAAEQMREELGLYQWPEWPLQDALRRSDAVDLAPAMAYYRTALELDPTNVTANRWLGQLELARGDYDAAYDHLTAAAAAGPRQRATRLLRAEAAAAANHPDMAAVQFKAGWAGSDALNLRIWWYNQLGEAEIAERLRKAATQ